MEHHIEYFDVVNKKGTRYRVAKCVCHACGHKHFISMLKVAPAAETVTDADVKEAFV